VFHPWAAGAQAGATSADFSGVVRDISRAPVPSASVSIVNADTSLQRQATSDADGRFLVAAVPPGTYTVRAALAGFATETLEGVELRLGGSTTIEIILRPATVTEEVSVVAEAPVIGSGQAVIANVISERQIAELPTNGRNFLGFSLITPGVIADRMPLQGATATSGLSFGGQSARANNITVDGLDNNDDVTGSVRATFSQDAVREFQVLAGAYSAEFGKASGGVVNIVTKSGTNTLTGSLFGYLRDGRLNAKEHFERFDPAGHPIDQAKAPYSQKQGGGVLGGPIRKDRTFFFGSFERLDVKANNFVTIDAEAATLLADAGFPVTRGHVPYRVRSNQLAFKVDHAIAAGQMLTLRYSYADGFNGNTESWGGLFAESRGGALDSRDQILAGSLTSVLSPRVVNEFRAQVAVRTQHLLSLDPTCDGPCDGNDEGGPTVEIGGVANAGRLRSTPQVRDNARYQALDTLSYDAGPHRFKTGFDFSLVDHTRSSVPLHFGGRYIFAALPAIPGLLSTPVSSIEAFAMGVPAVYIQGYGNPDAPYVTSDLSLFFQDVWRPSPRLAVEMGLRYQKQFWPTHEFSAPGVGAYRIPPDSNNLAPRLGLTWDPAGNGRLSLHGSYGVYYDNGISGAIAVPSIINGSAAGVRTLVLRVPQSIAAWSSPGRRLPEPAAGTFPSLVTAIDPRLKTSYTHQASLGLERQLPGRTTLAVSFLFVRGFNQLAPLDYNPLVPALGKNRRPGDVGGVPGTSTSVVQFTSFGQTWYRGLTVSFGRRFGDRYQLLAGYVLSKAEDTSADFQLAFTPQDSGMGRDPNNPTGLPVGFDPLQERGPSLQDQRHRFVVSGYYEAPLGLHVSGILTIGSGVPYNILAGADLNGDGDAGNFPTDRARTNPADPSTSVGRNAGRLPAEATVDVRLSRTFHVAGRSSLEALIEAFNLFDNVNHTDVNNVFGTGSFPDHPLPTYGQFLRAGPPRQVQVALRVTF
jgi:Carboxypeptidase regulatory-like domain